MAGPDAVSRSAHAPLVGREREVAEVRAALERREFVLVAGEAGIGKSRLVSTCLDELRPERVLVVRCLPYRQPQTLAAVVDAVRERVHDVGALGLSPLAGALRPLLPEWQDALPPSPQVGSGWELAQHLTFRAIAELLDALGIDTVVVEDAHWAEAATIDLLLHLSTRTGAVLVTYRADEVVPTSALGRLVTHRTLAPGGRLVSLEPLDIADTARLISALLDGADVSQSFATFLQQRTDGIPLAVEESVRLLVSRQDIAWVDGGWVRRTLEELDVPTSVRDAVLVRLAELGEPERLVADAAAVLGEPEQAGLVLEMAALAGPAGQRAIAELLERGLLVEDGAQQLAYRHALTARSALDAVARPRRVELHARAAAALARRAPQPVARLARHYREAGAFAEARRYAERAADLALATGDVATAVVVLHSSFTEPDLPLGDGLRLIEKLPLWGLTDRSSLGRIVERLRHWLTVAADHAERAEVRFHLSRMLLAVDDASAARAELAVAVDGLEHRPDLQARSLAILAAGREPDRPHSQVLQWRARAKELAPRLSRALQIDIELDVLSSELEACEGPYWERAQQMPRRPLEPQDSAAVLRCNLNLADQGMRWGALTDAAERIELACAQAAEQGLVRLHYLASSGRLHIDWLAGRWTGLPAALDALARHPGIDPEPTAESAIIALLLRCERDPSAPTRAELTAAIGLAVDQLSYGDACEGAAALTRIALDEGDADAAVAAGRDQIELVRCTGTWLFGADLYGPHVEALVLAGHRAVAQELSADVSAVAARSGAPALHAAALWASAAASPDRDAAARLFGESAAAWRSSGRPHSAALAGERRTRAEQSAAGGAARRGYGNSLSPREIEVVDLVATGCTNREIARALSRSPKTVSTQLQSAMRKLGVTSRTAAAVQAIERGLIESA